MNGCVFTFHHTNLFPNIQNIDKNVDIERECLNIPRACPFDSKYVNGNYCIFHEWQADRSKINLKPAEKKYLQDWLIDFAIKNNVFYLPGLNIQSKFLDIYEEIKAKIENFSIIFYESITDSDLHIDHNCDDQSIIIASSFFTSITIESLLSNQFVLVRSGPHPPHTSPKIKIRNIKLNNLLHLDNFTSVTLEKNDVSNLNLQNCLQVQIDQERNNKLERFSASSNQTSLQIKNATFLEQFDSYINNLELDIENSKFKSEFNLHSNNSNYKTKSLKIKTTEFYKSDFSGQKFSGNVQFFKCIFNKAPEFYDAKFSKAVDFRKSIFKDFNSEAVHAYRALRHIMEDKKFSTLAKEFFGYELKCLRKHSGLVIKMINFFYDNFADYGQSPGRILSFIVLFHITFTLILLYVMCTTYTELGAYWAQGNCWNCPTDAVRINFQLLVKPFIWLQYKNDILPYWFNVFCDRNLVKALLLSASHFIINYSLIALLILSVRKNFKMD